MEGHVHSNSKGYSNDQEDFINSICYTAPSSPNSKEFEFQNFSYIFQKNSHGIASPADELFYNGKLLPIHLPPGLQMVEKPLVLPKNCNSVITSPFQSCNISPATSCYVSGELNPEELSYECNKENMKKSWSKLKKLNLKLKESKAYLKSLFFKGKKNPFTQILVEEERGKMRRSFSMKGHVASKSSSSSFCSSINCSSFSSVNSNINVILKRSSSVNSDNECSIQGAIAYCKKSQLQVCAKK